MPIEVLVGIGLIVLGLGWKMWTSMVSAARQVDNPVNWPAMPTVPGTPLSVPRTAPATAPRAKPASSVEAWYRYRDTLLAQGAPAEEVEAMAEKTWKYLLLEAPSRDA